MKTRITQKVKDELKSLVTIYGYWSNEVKEYISNFEYSVALKLHYIARNF